jgi:hypothetical protein
MTSKNFALALMLGVFAALLLVAANTPVGTWQCVSADPFGGSEQLKWTLDVRDVAGKLAGTVASDQGEMSIDNPKFEGDTLTFSVSLDSGTYDITLKVDGDKLEGSWKNGSESGPIKGAKKA